MKISLHNDKTFFTFLYLLLISCFSHSFGQTLTAGDYRTKSGGLWSEISIWQKYTGSAWVDVTGANDYPGFKSTPTSVTISDGHNVTYDAAINGTKRLQDLYIQAGNTNTALTFLSGANLSVNGTSFVLAGGNNNVTKAINIGTGILNSNNLSLGDTNNSTRVCQITVSTGSIYVRDNIGMFGASDENFIRFTAAGYVSCGALISIGGTIIPSTGTVEFNGTSGYGSAAQTIGAYNFNNIILSGSGVKTLNALTTISGNLTINGTAVASLPTDTTYSVNALTLGTTARSRSTWGNNVSAANFNNTYFIATTGLVDVAYGPGDYRSKASGNWSTLSTWERWSGTIWQEPTILNNFGYPGLNSTTANVRMQNGHNIVADVSIDGAKKIARIELLGGTTATTFSFNSNIAVDVDGGVVINESTANRIINLGGGFLTCNAYRSENFSGSDIAEVIIATGTFAVVAANSNFAMNGSVANSILRFTDVGLLSCTGKITGGTLVRGTGTIEYNRTGNQTITSYSYNNLALTGSGTKTLPATSSLIASNLRISSGVIVSLNTETTYNINSLTLNCGGTIDGTWGNDFRNPDPTNINNTYFAATAGILNVATDSRINPPPAVIVIQPTCMSDNTGTITVPIQNVRDTYSFDNGINYQLSNVSPVLPAGTYNVIIKRRSGCTSPTMVVNLISAFKIWTGAINSHWSQSNNWFPVGLPTATDCISVPDVSNDLIIDGTNVTVSLHNLTVANGGNVTVNPTNSLIITDFVNVNSGGSLTFETTANLVQINNGAINSGVITYKRITPQIRETDYTYWSTPVESQILLDVSPTTKADKFYSFDAAVNNWVFANTALPMEVGKGYIIRGIPPPALFHIASFLGKPNNGTIGVPIIWDGTAGIGSSNLIGNPYPSAIDADHFLTTNSGIIDGTIYFWTHNTQIQNAAQIIGNDEFGNPKAGSGAMAYTSDDYASYNFSGGVATAGGNYAAEWIDVNNNRTVDAGEFVDKNGNNVLNTAEWTDGNSNMILETGEWNDSNNNRVAETGEWNDINKNGVLDLPGEWTDTNGNLIQDFGEWTDTNSNGIFNTGEWTDTNKDKILNIEVKQLSNRPTGFIAAGQAFFTTSLTASSPINVTFNNSMRLRSNAVLNNAQFFKTKDPKTKTVAIEKHRIWLDLTNAEGLFKQTLIGYISDATNEYDKRFDGISFDGNEFVDFYSVNQDKHLVIQGRTLPFDENDEVPLGYRTTINGEFTIKIDQTDGSLTNQAVFIEDKLTKTVFDLKTGDYKFYTLAGTFDDRFVLRYKNATLNTTDIKTQINQVIVSIKNKQIKINSFAQTIEKVAVYDLLSKQIYQKEKVNSNECVLDDFLSGRQTLIVKVSLQNGKAVTTKIIY